MAIFSSDDLTSHDRLAHTDSTTAVIVQGSSQKGYIFYRNSNKVITLWLPQLPFADRKAILNDQFYDPC
jgi:hypothetical protein